MKKLYVTLLGIIISFGAFAQSPLALTERQVNLGFGLFEKGTSFLVGMDFGIMDNITAGGELAVRSRNVGIPGGKVQYRGFGLGANMNYHAGKLFKLDPKIDVYGGLNLNYFRWNSDVIDYDGQPLNYTGKFAYSSGLNVDIQIGGRYFFSDRLAANLEFGGMSYSGGKIAVTYILK